MRIKNIKMKIFKAALAAALLGSFFLTGCSGGEQAAAENNGESVNAENQAEAGDDAQSEGDALQRIMDRGELIVATEGTWSPWTYHDEEDRLTGFDVELARKIAEHMGVEATFVEGEWDGLLAGMDGGRYDLVINGVDITEERAEKYDFSEPYAYNHTVIIVNSDNDDITGFDDLDGKRTANTISGTYAVLAESYGAEVVGVGALNESFELLKTGRVDATLNDEVTYYDYLGEHPEADFKVAAKSEDAQEVAIPMRKGEDTESLRAAVNEAIDALRESGELSELSEQFFGQDITGETE